LESVRQPVNRAAPNQQASSNVQASRQFREPGTALQRQIAPDTKILRKLVQTDAHQPETPRDFESVWKRAQLRRALNLEIALDRKGVRERCQRRASGQNNRPADSEIVGKALEASTVLEPKIATDLHSTGKLGQRTLVIPAEFRQDHCACLTFLGLTDQTHFPTPPAVADALAANEQVPFHTQTVADPPQSLILA
jgi:hypothetical protein